MATRRMLLKDALALRGLWAGISRCALRRFKRGTNTAARVTGGKRQGPYRTLLARPGAYRARSRSE